MRKLQADLTLALTTYAGNDDAALSGTIFVRD